MKLVEIFPDGRFGHAAATSDVRNAELGLGAAFPPELKSLYLQCDGFREKRGNAKYLLSLTDEDSVGSLISTTRFMWSEVKAVNLKQFIFFGYSGADEAWGISTTAPSKIIAYHHHMKDKFEVIGTSIVEVFINDQAAYDDANECA